ncbi:MAG: MATE family efflux transporter [Myxococcota bacterium]|nr:MATE family efflux transporter [Myxococcota bacterium]
MKNNTDKSRLDQFIKNPKRAVWSLALPMMAGFTVYALYAIVDAAFIGQLGPTALAAATFVDALFLIAIALGVGFATGVTATVAQAIGRRNSAHAEHIASNALGLGFLIGLGFAVFGLTLGPILIPLLGADAQTAVLAWHYFQILCIIMPFTFITMTMRAVLTGEGDAKTPMIIVTIATLLNAALDPVFIFTLNWGIRGAAIATCSAQAFSLIAYFYVVVIRKRSFIRFDLEKLRPNWPTIAPILAIGLPTTGGQLVMAVGTGFFNRLLAEFGQTAVAGYGAGTKVDLIVALPILGLAGAAVSVVGMFAGANRPDLVRSTALYTYRWVITIAVTVGLIAYCASPWIIGLFTEDGSALEIGITYLRYVVFAYPLMAFGMTSGRILQGLGHGMPALLITLVRVLLVGVLTAYLAVYLFEAPIEAVWMAIIAGGIVATVMAFIWIRKRVFYPARPLSQAPLSQRGGVGED